MIIAEITSEGIRFLFLPIVEESKIKERFYINLFDSYNFGYNSTLGGDGNNGIIMSEESNKKRSQALQGKPIDKKLAGDDRFKLWNDDLGIKQYFHLEVRSSTSIRIEHDFTLEQALKVLQVLRDYPTPESED